MYDILERGEEFLCKKRPLVLGISPGNSYYYKNENLVNLLNFAENNSDKVLQWRLFLTGGIIKSQTIFFISYKIKGFAAKFLQYARYTTYALFFCFITPVAALCSCFKI